MASANLAVLGYALVAQLVEHVLGKDGVIGSNPIEGSNRAASGEPAPGPDLYTFVDPLDIEAAKCVNLPFNYQQGDPDGQRQSEKP